MTKHHHLTGKTERCDGFAILQNIPFGQIIFTTKMRRQCTMFDRQLQVKNQTSMQSPLNY